MVEEQSARLLQIERINGAARFRREALPILMEGMTARSPLDVQVLWKMARLRRYAFVPCLVEDRSTMRKEMPTSALAD